MTSGAEVGKQSYPKATALSRGALVLYAAVHNAAMQCRETPGLRGPRTSLASGAQVAPFIAADCLEAHLCRTLATCCTRAETEVINECND